MTPKKFTLLPLLTLALASASCLRSESATFTPDLLSSPSPEEWEVAYTTGGTAPTQALLAESFGWVATRHRADAIALLADDAWRRLSEQEAARFGVKDLNHFPPGAVTLYLLRGVKVLADEDNRHLARDDRLIVEYYDSSIQVTHQVSRVFPFDTKSAHPVVALLPRRPSDVCPQTRIVFYGGVSPR